MALHPAHTQNCSEAVHCSADAWLTPVPVKNTFISFDPLPLSPLAVRPRSCPASRSRAQGWEVDLLELCHAMTPSVPRRKAPVAVATSSHSSATKNTGGMGAAAVSSGVATAQTVVSASASMPSSAEHSTDQEDDSASGGGVQQGAQGKEADAISEVSTTPSEDAGSRANQDAHQANTWTSVLRKKPPHNKQQAQQLTTPKSQLHQPSQRPQLTEGATPRTPAMVSSPKWGGTKQLRSGSGTDQGTAWTGADSGAALAASSRATTAVQANVETQKRPAPTPAPAPARQQQSSSFQANNANSAKGPYSRGMPYFQKMEVGVNDDPDFRVVQKLIGPRGKNTQEIIAKANGGVKIWIVGRGSRSWEDDVGPLVICVGAVQLAGFEVAVKAIEELLVKVRKEYAEWSRS